MKIAISGASGLVGTTLTDSLRKAGHVPVRLVRPAKTEKATTTGESGEDIIWDPSTGVRSPQQLESVDAIVHLAGRSIASSRWTDAEKKKIRDSRVAATQRLVEQLGQLNRPPAVFVSASAIGIYGDTGDKTVEEDYPSNGGFLARVARDWEAAADPLRSQVRVAHARLGIVMSSRGGALAKVLPLFRWMLGGRLGAGTQYWSWISLEDCVRAIVWMLENETAAGPYNVVAPQPVTNAEFTRQLAKTVHRPVGLPVPKFALRIAMGEMADALLLCSCRARPSRLLASGFQFNHSTLQHCLEAEVARKG